MAQTAFPDFTARTINLGHAAARIQAILILTAVYFLAAKLGLSLAMVHASATAVWPPSGIALAAIVRMGPWAWPGVFIGAFLANLTTAGNVAASAGIALGNTLEALAGAWLMQRFARGVLAFDRPKHIVLYAVLVGMFSTALSATIGVLSLAAGGLLVLERAAPVWFTWWLGDATSMLTVAPMILAWGAKPHFQFTRTRLLEAGAILATVFVIGQIIFGGWAPPGIQPYLLPSFAIPPLLWAAFRIEQRGSTTATFLLSMLALQGTLRGFGPLIGFEGNARLLALQIFIAMVSITSLIIAAIVSQLTQSLLEKEILLREIHHRVKNNLQVISSLLSLQHDSRHEGNASDQLQESQSRIKSMALIHESLYKASDLTRVDAKAYLRRLVDYLWSAYGGRGRIVERDLETDEVALSVDTAVPCGLIVNELVTNALRHAFPDGRAGRIRISLRQSAAGWLTLEVKDNGIGAPASVVSQETGGLGLRLVRALSEQLGGKLTVSHEGGTTFAVMFAEGRTLPPPERSQPGAIHPSKRLAPARTR